MVEVSFPGLGLNLTLNRVAFSIGGLDIYWYGVIIALGIGLAMWFGFSKTRAFGIDTDRFIDVFIVGAICGVIGARLYYVIFSSPGEFTSFWQIFNLRQGGLAFYGAVIGGVGSAIITCRWRKIKLLPAIDLAAYGFLIGQSVGRWGNFFNQEAFGSNTTLPWGMISSETTLYLQRNAAALAEKGVIVDPSMPVHPTFLYESVWLALGFLILFIYMKHRKFDGEIFLMYIAWNGFGRAFIEGLRTDSLYWGSIRISQLLAIVGAIAAVAVIGLIRRKIAKSEDENYLMPYGYTPQAAEELQAIREQRDEAEKARAEKKAQRKSNAGGTDNADTEQADVAQAGTPAVSESEAQSVSEFEQVDEQPEPVEKEGEKPEIATEQADEKPEIAAEIKGKKSDTSAEASEPSTLKDGGDENADERTDSMPASESQTAQEDEERAPKTKAKSKKKSRGEKTDDNAGVKITGEKEASEVSDAAESSAEPEVAVETAEATVVPAKAKRAKKSKKTAEADAAPQDDIEKQQADDVGKSGEKKDEA